MRIVLTGFMGTGKTVVARELAARLRLACVDLDREIERRAGMTVAEIFASRGEAGFRELERAAVSELAARDGVVVATGGGAIADEQNFAQLSRGSVMVRLSASPAEIVRRVGPSVADRPLLRGHIDLEARVRELLDRRAPIYARVPFAVGTDGLSPAEVADHIVARLADAAAASVREAGS